MTEEIKADMEDMKDFGHQARLELKMKGREMKQDLKEKINEATGSKENTTKDRAEIKLHNAEDTMKQVGLEVKKKARDAKAAINKSGPKQALDSAAIATGDALVDAKDTVKDAVGPSSVPVEGGVMVEKTSSTGVDISHIEGGGEAPIIREQRKAAERAERDAQRQREKKRQELVDDTKAKLHVAKEKTSEVAETVGEKLKDVVDQAGVELGKAAVVLKDKLDDYTDDRPREKVTPKISDTGVNISSIQNARNDEIAATQARVREIEKSKEPGPMTKAKEKISQAVDSLKESYHDATHDPPKPIFVHKTSSHGVDISHIESGMNERLAAKEAARLEAEKRAEREHDKAVIQARVVDPLKYDAAETKDGMLDQSDSLKAKMSALGDSISRAAHKLSDKVAESWNELTQKDESSTLDQDQEMRALDRDDANTVAPTTSSNPAPVGSRQGEPLKDKVIRNTLDAGVALRESLSSASSSSSAPIDAAPSSRRDVDSNVDLTSKVSAASHELKESASIQADKVAHKASKLKRKAIEKLNQEQGTIPPNPANYVDPHAPVAPSAPVMAASTDPAPGASALLSALPPVAPSSTTTSNTSQSSSSSTPVDPKPDLDRVNTLPVVATASPMTPDTFQTFKANP